MRILVDMDDVIADFDKEFITRWRKQYGHLFNAPDEFPDFEVKSYFPEHLGSLVESIYTAPGFVRALPVIEGSLEALSEMKSKKNEVFICTSPLTQYENCVLEKYQWVDEHLGKEWVKRMILTKDKTMVSADILIDDKPKVTGIAIPSWEHVLFDHLYNRHINDKRRLTWKNWKEVLNFDYW